MELTELELFTLNHTFTIFGKLGLTITLMQHSIKQLQESMVEQLKRRGYYPKDEKEALLRLGEELGEVFEAVREDKSFKELSHEVVDVFWNLLRFCELRGIDLEKSFWEKYKINEGRPLNGPITDVSQNS